MSDLWKTQAAALASVCVTQFGDLSTYIHKSGETWTMRLIFRESSGDEEITAPGVYTIAFGKVPEFVVYPSIGDQIVYQSKTYYVYKIDADGQGGINLMLRERK